MFSLVISAPGVLSNPLPDTPTIPDVQSNIIYELDAASLAALADGAAVDTWLANGPAPIVNRTFNFQYTGWGKPKFSLTGGPGGNPAVLFDGTQQIGNGPGTVAVAQSMTYAMVVNASVFAANQARLMASGAQILAPGANGFYESISAASRLESADKIDRMDRYPRGVRRANVQNQSRDQPSRRRRDGSVSQRTEYSGGARICAGDSGTGRWLRLYQGLRSSVE